MTQLILPGYKWLKWVPNSVIKGAFAAEWKMQTYRIGRPPPLVHRPISNIASPSPSDSSLDRADSMGSQKSTPDRSSRRRRLAHRASQLLTGKTETPHSPQSTPPSLPLRATTPPVKLQVETHSSTDSPLLPESSQGLDLDSFSILSQEHLARSEKPPVDGALIRALEQASHAECEPGTTDDLLCIILNRAQRPWGFSYTDLTQKSTVWWGTEDERIAEKTVRWMERSMDAELRIVSGADHNLMQQASVICEILQDVSDRSRNAAASPAL